MFFFLRGVSHGKYTHRCTDDKYALKISQRDRKAGIAEMMLP